jgi:Transglutaminase-like superfamily.
MKKRIVCLFLGIIMLFSCTTIAFAATPVSADTAIIRISNTPQSDLYVSNGTTNFVVIDGISSSDKNITATFGGVSYTVTVSGDRAWIIIPKSTQNGLYEVKFTGISHSWLSYYVRVTNSTLALATPTAYDHYQSQMANLRNYPATSWDVAESRVYDYTLSAIKTKAADIVKNGRTEIAQLALLDEYFIKNYDYDDSVQYWSYDSNWRKVAWSTEQIIKDVWSTGTGNCEGISRLKEYMARSIGIRSMTLTGTASGKVAWKPGEDISKWTGHAWNAFRLSDGQTIVSDTTWLMTSNSTIRRYQNASDFVMAASHNFTFDKVTPTPPGPNPGPPSPGPDVNPPGSNPTYSNQVIKVDGNKVPFDTYIKDGTAYVKPRDLAYSLRETNKPFDYAWSNYYNSMLITKGTALSRIANVLQNAGAAGSSIVSVTRSVTVANGSNYTTWNIGGYEVDGEEFLELRKLAEIADFGLSYSNGQIIISTSTTYK